MHPISRPLLALRASRQTGFSLVIGMVLVFAATLLGLGGAMLATQNSQSSTGWSDRQKALFVAEGTMKIAEAQTQTFVTANLSNVAGALGTSGYTTFYPRSTAPNWTPWPTASATSVQVDPTLPKGQYFVVYEGATAITGTGFTNGSGAATGMASNLYKFTIYAYANGAKPGTQVILAVHRQYSQ